MMKFNFSMVFEHEKCNFKIIQKITRHVNHFGIKEMYQMCLDSSVGRAAD